MSKVEHTLMGLKLSFASRPAKLDRSSREGELASLVGQGDRARDARDWHQAVTAYSEALAADPSLAHIWVQYGHALKESGDLLKALSAYRSALELEPGVADTHLQLGHALKVAKQYAEAAKEYLSSYRLDPESRFARLELKHMGWTDREFELALLDRPIGSAPPLSAEPDTSPKVAAPAGYIESNPDVVELLRLGLVESPDQHYRLYGYREGREIIHSLAKTKPTRAFVLCPSNFKRCGIGEHARYIAVCLEKAGLDVHRLRTTKEVLSYDTDYLRDSVLIVNHGPGLFDGYNPELSEGESTSDLIAALLFYFKKFSVRPIIYLHSLLDNDNSEMFGKQDFILESPIPTVTTISSAAEYFHIPHIDHGVQPLDRTGTWAHTKTKMADLPSIGFFGFLQFGGKDFDAIANTVTALSGRLVGSVASRDPDQIKRLREIMVSRGVRCDLATGWIEDDELARRLGEADILYLPQKDHDHWNNSGTARFCANLDLPLIVPPHQPFLDLGDVAIFSEEADVPKIISYLRAPENFGVAVERVRRFRTATPMEKTVDKLVYGLDSVLREQLVHGFIDCNTTSAFALSNVPQDTYEARLRMAGISVAGTTENKSIAEIYNDPQCVRITRAPVSEKIQLWRKNYKIEDFIIPNRQDLLFSVYRRLQKREPTFFEYTRKTVDLRADASCRVEAGKVGEWLVDAIASSLDDNAGYSGPLIELSGFGKALSRRDLLHARADLATKISAAFDRAYDVTRDLTPSGDLCLDPVYDRNLLQLLCLPAGRVERAVEDACRLADRAIDARGLATLPTIRQRYLFLLTLLAQAGIRPSDIFVMDNPVVIPVAPQRRLYATAEFVVHDGDAFLTATIRALLKRDPLVIEMLTLTPKLQREGKFSVIREIATTMVCNASVVDLERPDPIALAITEMAPSERWRMFNDVRSVGGNWALRNAHLVADRNFRRLWLRLKSAGDLWWEQGGRTSESFRL